MTSSISASPLNHCCNCNSTLSLPETLSKDLVVTICCFKIFHITCLADWVKRKKTCAHCSQPLDPTKAGKSLTAIWRVFQIATHNHAEDVCTIFSGRRLIQANDKEPFYPDLECSICCNEFPSLGVDYLPASQRFSHSLCATPKLHSQEVPLSKLAWLTKELVQKYPSLAQYFSHQKT